MLKISKVAERLSLSVPTVRTIPSDRLPVFFTPRGQRRYREEDVDAYLSANRRVHYDAKRTFAWGLATRFAERITSGSLGVLRIVLFGSYARGDFDKESDIDVFVVVKNRNYGITSQIVDASGEGSVESAHLVTPFIMAEDEFERHHDEPICQAIEREGVVVWQQ